MAKTKYSVHQKSAQEAGMWDSSRKRHRHTQTSDAEAVPNTGLGPGFPRCQDTGARDRAGPYPVEGTIPEGQEQEGARGSGGHIAGEVGRVHQEGRVLEAREGLHH